MKEESVDREAVSDLGILYSGEIGPFRPRWKLRRLRIWLAIALGAAQVYVVGRAGVRKGIEWNAGHLFAPSKPALARWWVALVKPMLPVCHRLGIRKESSA